MGSVYSKHQKPQDFVGWIFKIKERMSKMKPITKEYLLLFNTITDLEKTLEHLRQELLAVQRQAEEIFLSEES